MSQVPVAHWLVFKLRGSVREEAESLRFGAPGGGELELTDSRVLWVTQQGLLPRRGRVEGGRPSLGLKMSGLESMLRNAYPCKVRLWNPCRMIVLPLW